MDNYYIEKIYWRNPSIPDAAAGGSDDYAYGTIGIKYSYTPELRDTGTHGFSLPEDQIESTGEEIWLGLQAFATKLHGEIH